MEMTFGEKHYVPVMRCRPAETEALAKLAESAREKIVPVIELCPADFIPKPTKKNNKIKVEDVLKNKLRNLTLAMNDQPFFLDLWHMKKDFSGSDGKNLWFHVLEHCNRGESIIVPVTGFYGKGIDDQKLISRISQEIGNGVCIRLLANDFQRPSLASDLKQLLDFMNLPPSRCDLVIDLQIVDDKSLSIAEICRRVPLLSEWRTFSVVGGSFPRDLSGMRANNVYDLERKEWKKWQREALRSNPIILRLPTYGDYAVQHPVYHEPVSKPHVSASIRYTVSNSWIIYRGEWIGKKTGMGSAQYPAEAQLLVERSEYSGATFSYGDEFIMKKTLNGLHPGGIKDWLVVAMNHHLTYVVDQISQLHAEKEAESATRVLVRVESNKQPQ